ncbi:MAG: hypothetical protein QY326_03230 [Bdellovibrionota bacterium]|nr:MAG: hypothetical protein QY326_03230 [Bdellovibrionota bacterium]
MCKDLIKGIEFDLSPGASPLDVDLVLASSSLKAISVYEYKTQTPPFNMSLVQETAVQSGIGKTKLIDGSYWRSSEGLDDVA